MSEEGGLEEVEESFRAAANCSRNWANSACTAANCACRRSQPAQEVLRLVFMPAILERGQSPGPCHVNAYSCCCWFLSVCFAVGCWQPTRTREPKIIDK